MTIAYEILEVFWLVVRAWVSKKFVYIPLSIKTVQPNMIRLNIFQNYKIKEFSVYNNVLSLFS